MTQRVYENFDVSLSRDGDAYHIRVQSELVGEESTTFELLFSRQELGTFGWLPENRALRLVEDDRAGSSLSPKEFGQRLFADAFPGQIGALLQTALDKAEERQSGLRIRLSIDDDLPELADLPWEFLYDKQKLRFFVHSEWAAIVRYMQLSLPPPEALTVKLPLRILAVISDPEGAPRLAVEEEWQRLRTALRELEENNLVILERAERAEMTALDERMRVDDVHILHFIGHGFFDPDQDIGGLVMEDDKRQMKQTDADRFGELFADRRNLRLVFLNACQGAEIGHNFFGGVAQKLVRVGVPAVIAMQYPVTDKAAITISHEFYAALAAGEPVDSALTRSRRQVYLDGDDREWGTPVLFSQSSDNQLIVLPSEDGDAGATLLASLMASPEILATVDQFRTDFAAASKQIDIVGAYKALHDQLHILHHNAYTPMVIAQRRFPDDPDVFSELVSYQSNLQTILANLREIAQRGIADEDDLSWVEDVERSAQHLVQAIDGSNDVDTSAQFLQTSVQIMKIVLVGFPSMIDGRLSSTARDLRLDSIQQALGLLQDRLAAQQVEPTIFQSFFTEADVLTDIGSRLHQKVLEHNRWQRADRALTNIDEMLDYPDRFDELNSSWPNLQTDLSQLTDDPSQLLVPELQAASQGIDRVLSGKEKEQADPRRIRQSFRTYRSLASQRFFFVDKDLLKLCDDLKESAARLKAHLDNLEQSGNES